MNKIVKKEYSEDKKGRMANLELLRCLAMMMVVVLHFLGKGNLLGDLAAGKIGNVGTAAWLLEAFCIVAVNLYMTISGFFLCESSFKLSRLLKLVLQVWSYSVGVGLVAVLLGFVPEGERGTFYFLQLLFPISMGHYWFLTAYIFLYLLTPFLTIAVQRMTKEQLRTAVILLLVVFCGMKSILPVRLEMDSKGYDCLWYICVFLTAAYLRRYGMPSLERGHRALVLYVLSVLGIFAELMCLHVLYGKTGKLGLLLTVSVEYNHILPFLAAVGLFISFLKIQLTGSFARLVCRIAPYTLGVYLLHENLGVRNVWQSWFGAERIASVWELVFRTCMAVVVMFSAGIAVDWLRAILMRGLHGVLVHVGGYRKLMEGIGRGDTRFRQQSKE